MKLLIAIKFSYLLLSWRGLGNSEKTDRTDELKAKWGTDVCLLQMLYHNISSAVSNFDRCAVGV